MVDSVRVLHVDDDPAVADLAATILDREEDMFDVVSTTNPTEAIELLERRFDCIVSDYRMPEIDGLELLEVVREIHPDLPFIIFTGCGSEEVASEAISAGVTGYVPKGSGTTPYESLANQIRNAVEGYRTGRGDDECDGIDESDLDRVLGAYVTTRTDDGAVTVDECSDRFADQLGYAPSDILGKPLSSLVVDDIETPFDTTEDPAATDDAGTADADETWQTTTFEGADGEPVPMRYRTVPGFETDRTLIAFVDDSERVALAEKVTWYQELVNTVPDALYALDEDMHYLFVNEGMAELTGFPREEIIGAHKSLVNSEESVESGRIKRQDLIENERDGMKVGFHPHVTADGEEIPTEVRFRALPSDDGFRGTAGVVRDITERIEREHELERQNRRLDEFASVVTHDLRNPLNVVEGRVELAREDCECGDADEHLVVAQAELERMNDLIDDVLSFSRHGEQVTEYETIELHDVVETAWDAVDSNDARLVVEDGLAIRANRLRLQRLFENLLRNAIEHVGADVTVRVGSVAATTEPGNANTGEGASPFAGFYVADDGPGIPPERRDEAFDLGVTTARNGTGFGLAIVETIAETHGWSVEITESEMGGAQFDVSGVECHVDSDRLEERY